MSAQRPSTIGLALAIALALLLLASPPFAKASQSEARQSNERIEPTSPSQPQPIDPAMEVNAAIATTTPEADPPPSAMPRSLAASAQTIALFALVSLIPAAVLMVSAFVRISIVLSLLRQAIGSAQVPGNQVLMALSLLLTAVVMWPVGERVYEQSIQPFAEGQLGAVEAWEAGSEPIKAFMIEQICRTRHEHYLTALYDHLPESSQQPEPTVCEEFPLRIIAPAFLLSELTTALFIGFAIYLPFLVIDLVVAAILSAMGLFLLPPSLVALPLKLILFVLADGWLLVADMLLRSFGGLGP